QSFTAFSDHHHFSPADFAAFGDSLVLMTEKDAVKCRAFARPNWWYLPVDAKLPQDFEQQFLTHIQQVIDTHGI
ncbi:MAG: tetraacyldisaccharide 4'-kinase, partial [Psychrosphaera sp.]|nr:tetraacyldisaccharide 4'-kinase [Psychrosphaera sp.]